MALSLIFPVYKLNSNNIALVTRAVIYEGLKLSLIIFSAFAFITGDIGLFKIMPGVAAMPFYYEAFISTLGARPVESN